jgi:hypothetical protein
MKSSAIAVGLLALCLAGCGGARDETPAPSVTIEGLYPEFHPGVHRYVSRCGRGGAPIRVEAGDGVAVKVGGGPARSGSFRVDPGVRPGADFAISTRGQSHDTYSVRCLPADFPAWRFERLGEVDPGLFVVSFRASSDSRPWVIVFDHGGTPRWWYSPATRALWGQVLNDGTVAWARSFGDGYGLDPRMAHEVRTPSGKLLRLVRTRGSIIDGHEFREVGDGNVLVDSYVPETANLRRYGGPVRAAIVSAAVQELNPRGGVRWRWSSRGEIALAETGRWWRNVLSNSKRRQGRAAFDPVHINSIEPRGPDEVVISTRHTDAIYGIDRSSGEIAWKLGGSKTKDSLRVLGDPANKLFGGQHDARIAQDGSLSVYDNGKDRPRRPRVVFYSLDPKRGTARYLSQLNDPAVKASHCCGSARQLADGGWLVSWGDNPLVTAFDAEERIVFRLELAASTFRAVPVPPGAVSIAELDRGLEAMEREGD